MNSKHGLDESRKAYAMLISHNDQGEAALKELLGKLGPQHCLDILGRLQEMEQGDEIDNIIVMMTFSVFGKVIEKQGKKNIETFTKRVKEGK